MTQQGARPEDDLLDPENFIDLNESFYRTAPHEHFQQKIFQLLFAAGRPDDLNRAAQEGGLQIGGLSLNPNPARLWRDSEQHEQFLAVESEVLLHHLGEALLRLYLAHESIPPCPWLEVARLRNFAQFKRLLRARFLDSGEDDRRADVADIFFGARSRDDLFAGHPEPSQEVWAKGARNIEGFLGFYARHVLGYSNLYNAAKHGFAINPAHATSSLSKTPIRNLSSSSRVPASNTWSCATIRRTGCVGTGLRLG
jgi:hypothetical protein